MGKLEDETIRANRWRTAWAEAEGELRFIEDHPDGYKAIIAELRDALQYIEANAVDCNQCQDSKKVAGRAWRKAWKR